MNSILRKAIHLTVLVLAFCAFLAQGVVNALAAVSPVPMGTVYVKAYDQEAANGAAVYLDNNDSPAGTLSPPSGFVACLIGSDCSWVELTFNAPTGTHTIRVVQDDYDDFTKQISVNENQEIEVQVTLASKI